jgi:hypothetical protein
MAMPEYGSRRVEYSVVSMRTALVLLVPAATVQLERGGGAAAAPKLGQMGPWILSHTTSLLLLLPHRTRPPGEPGQM